MNEEAEPGRLGLSTRGIVAASRISVVEQRPTTAAAGGHHDNPVSAQSTPALAG